MEDSVLKSYFEAEILDKAAGDCRRRKVITVSWQDNETLHGRVAGAREIHTCLIYFSHDRSQILGTDCTCANAYDCRHVAAVLLSHLGSPESTVPAPEKPNPEAVANVPAQEVPDERENNEPVNMLSELAKPSILSGMLNAAVDRHYFNEILGVPGPAFEQQGVTEIFGLSEPARLLKNECLKPKADLQEALQSIGLLNVLLSKNAAGIFNDENEVAIPSLESDSRILYILGKGGFESDPSIDAVAIIQKKNGSTAEQKLGAHEAFGQLPSCATSEDYAIFRLYSVIWFWKRSQAESGEFIADDLPACFNMLMTRVLTSGRCFLESKDGPLLSLGEELPGRLAWSPIENGQLKLTLVAQAAGKTYDCLPWRFPWYLNRESGQMGSVAIDINEHLLAELRKLRPIDERETIALLSLISDLRLKDIIPIPEGKQDLELRITRVRPKLLAVRLQSTRFSSKIEAVGQRLVRALLLSCPPDFATDRAYIDSSGKTIVQKQDRDFEDRVIQTLKELNFKDVSCEVDDRPPNERYFLAESDFVWSELDEKKIALLKACGCDISKEQEQELKPISVGDRDIQIRIANEDRWWFSLDIQIDLNGKKVPLIPLLKSALSRLSSITKDSVESLNRNGKFVSVLDTGEAVVMPFERIRTMLLALQELFDRDEASLRASALHLAELLEDEFIRKLKWIGAENLLRFVDKLRRLKELEPAVAPQGLNAVLRSYQLDGLAWLQHVSGNKLGGILADDMGLGKTIQLLAHILLEKESGRLQPPVLVVCPTSVLPNWQNEIRKFAPGLSHVAYAGQDRTAVADKLVDFDIVLTSYALVTRDLDILKAIAWHAVVLDEAQAIKNPSSKVAQSVKKLSAGYRFCLTGTPVENHLGELWSQFDFVMPGLLGDRVTFARHIRTPIEKYKDSERLTALRSRIRPFLLRRTKAQVLDDLPEKSVIIKHVNLSSRQLDLYETVRAACDEQIRKEIARNGFKKCQLIILDAMLKLRQACCDPRILAMPSARDVEESAKLETLMEMVEQLASEGRKMLVFSQFTSMLDLIASELEQRELPYVELRGDTKDRLSPVQQFQESEVPVFLVSLKAGGVGLNLTAADVVIHYDPWWNPAVEDQATDRAYRIGQDKHVFVYKLIAYGTIEHWMLGLQEEKRSLASSIYDDRGNLGTDFSESDLSELLRPVHDFARRTNA